MPSNRPGPLLSRTGTPNQNSPYPGASSPSLSPKVSNIDNIPLSTKTSPITYTFTPAGNSYASPATNQRSFPQPLNDGSPSISMRSLVAPNVNHPTYQSTLGIKTDTNSIRSEDSTTSSEEHVHPASFTQSITSRAQEISSPYTRHRQHQTHPSSGGNLMTHLNNTNSSSTGTTISSATGVPFDRIPSPSPSLLSEREREENERLERELESKRKRLQIYVFICRCIACPFNSKQTSDMGRKHLKVTLVQYGVIKERFLGFLNGKTHIEADEGKGKRNGHAMKRFPYNSL